MIKKRRHLLHHAAEALQHGCRDRDVVCLLALALFDGQGATAGPEELHDIRREVGGEVDSSVRSHLERGEKSAEPTATTALSRGVLADGRGGDYLREEVSSPLFHGGRQRGERERRGETETMLAGRREPEDLVRGRPWCRCILQRLERLALWWPRRHRKDDSYLTLLSLRFVAFDHSEKVDSRELLEI